MPSPIQLTFAATLQGSTLEGIITPVQFNTSLEGQDTHTQMSMVIEAGAINKLVDLPDNQGLATVKQVMFMLKSNEPVQFVINGNPDLTFAVVAGWPFCIPGQPEVKQLEFTSLSAAPAKVFITRLFGNTILPTIGVGGVGAVGNLKIDAYTATASQTVFTLTQAPANPTGLMFYIEGLLYTAQSGFFTVSGTTVTWSGFAIPLGARVEAIYQ